MLLLLLLLLLLHHDGSLQPTRDGPPPTDEQIVSAITGRVGCALVWSTGRHMWRCGKGAVTSQGHNSGV